MRAAKFARINENMVKRKLNELPDELILKIFSFLPAFNESVAAHLISKRWDDSWKLVSDVTLDDDDDDDESFVTFLSFVYESLLSNDAQILERLHLKLSGNYSASDINFWVQLAVSRYVRKLRFDLFGGTLELPSCLSTCTTLKSLILCEVSIKVIPPGPCLPSLKSLHLFSVEFFGDKTVASLLQSCPDLEYLVLNQTKYIDWILAPCFFCLSSLKSLHLCSVQFSSRVAITRLLQSCPVLEHLVISRTNDDKVRLFNIDVPTLKSLSINDTKESSIVYMNNPAFRINEKDTYVEENHHGFVINAPSLEILNFKDTFSNFIVFDMLEANIEVICDQSKKLIGSFTSIQHLSLCSPASETPYPSGTVFPYLEHLELCTCSEGWANLLASILNDAPRLQSLNLKSQHSARYNDPMNLWKEPSVVPDCLSTHLEILEWRQYEGTEKERNIAAYILGNATCLKMATFSTRCIHNCTALKKMSRVLSETCQLVCKQTLMWSVSRRRRSF